MCAVAVWDCGLYVLCGTVGHVHCDPLMFRGVRCRLLAHSDQGRGFMFM